VAYWNCYSWHGGLLHSSSSAGPRLSGDLQDLIQVLNFGEVILALEGLRLGVDWGGHRWKDDAMPRVGGEDEGEGLLGRKQGEKPGIRDRQSILTCSKYLNYDYWVWHYCEMGFIRDCLMGIFHRLEGTLSFFFAGKGRGRQSGLVAVSVFGRWWTAAGSIFWRRLIDFVTSSQALSHLPLLSP
jgi:hypothetical protein